MAIKLKAARLAAAAALLFAGAGAAQAAESAVEGQPQVSAAPAASTATSAAPQLPVVLTAPQESAFETLSVRPSEAVLMTGRARPDRAEPAVASAKPVPTPEAEAEAAPLRESLERLVARFEGSETPNEEAECLARAVYFESRGEPLEGQLAVAEVILNRVRSGRFRATICDVVRQPYQFSFVRRGTIPEAPRASAPWRRSVAIAHIALNELHEVTGDHSLFFHATYVRPNWGRPRIAQIGRHIFYR